MNRRIWVAALGIGSLCAFGQGTASADSLLLKDGRLISGQVTHAEGGYVVHTGAGDMKFTDDQVQHWTRAQPADGGAAPAAPAAPATRTATGIPGAGTPGTVASSPGTSAPKGRDKATIQKTVAALLERGNDALAATDYRAARDAFADALSLEPKNVQAAQGAGYAYLVLNNYPKARDALEIAYAGSQPPSRSVACNLAVALGKTRNPMRAAKVLKEYLVAHPQPLDEPALNALAATLFQADEATRRNSFFAQMGTFYDDYNRKLEATRPGEKRWGSQWLPSSEADAKLSVYYQKRSQVEALNKRVSNARASFNSAARACEDAIADSRFQKTALSRVPGYKQQMAAADSEYQVASRELEVALKDFEMPPIDESLAIVAPDLSGAPPAAPTAIASAGPAASAKPPGTAVASGSSGSTGSIFGPDSGSSGPSGSSGSPVSPRSSGPSASTRTPRTPGNNPGGTAVLTAVHSEPPAPTRKLHVRTEAVAFPVAPELLVTTAAAADHPTSISVQLADGSTVDAEFVAQDDAAGLALVRLKDKTVPYLPLADSFGGGAVTCIGFPDVSLFDPVPVAIPGTASNKAPHAAGSAGAPAAAGASATEAKWTVNLARSPRLGGGPLLVNGKVVGVQLANRDTDHAAVPFATLDDLKRLLSTNLPAPGGGLAADPRSVTMQLTATKERG